MKRFLYWVLLLVGVVEVAGVSVARAEERPRLVVQIVVGSLRAEDIDRYIDRCEEGGFRLLLEEGICYEGAAYNYQQTLTPTALATLTTGSLPATHGVVTSHWYDYIDNRRISLVEDKSVVGLEYHTGGGNFSPRQLVAPAISESLRDSSPESRTVTIALEPESAIVMGGKAGICFWMNSDHCQWRSSSYYLSALPDWVNRYNTARSPMTYLMKYWTTLYDGEVYKNRRCAEVLLSRLGKGQKSIADQFQMIKHEIDLGKEYNRMRYTPAGCSALVGFTKLALAQLELGKDEHPDLLNICFDSPRYIAEAFGPESVEAEDMFYRLDRELCELIRYIRAQVGEERVAFVLTADHGTSPSYDRAGGGDEQRFNIPQFEMLLETFLDARYGKCPTDWVLGYEDQTVWLNHNLIYEKRLSLSEIQNEAAAFAMQFRGVSHALSGTALRSSYFGSGYAERMQNSFYPRRSGDVVLNLMPGWIEKREGVRSSSGSMYGYDRHVPLIFLLPNTPAQRITRSVKMESVAPTVAHILGIPSPATSEGEPLSEITQ